MNNAKGAVRGQLGDVYTHLPGVVVAYEPKGMRATVRPAMPKMLADGTSLEPPQIVDVPVCWPVVMCGQAHVVMPLAPGDPVELHFSQRSLDQWKSGDHSAPTDPRWFDISDCTAHPCSDHRQIDTDGQCIHLRIGAAELKMYADGRIIMNGQLQHTGDTEQNGDVQLAGTMTAANDVKGGGISLKGHVHGGVQGGPSNTEGPQ